MMLRMLVSRSGDDSDPDAPLPCADRLSADVKKLKWIDDRVIKMADQHRCLDFGRAEIIVALANLVHGPLHKRNRHAFTREELFRLLNKDEHLTVADDIARLFLSKFDPQSPLAAAEVAGKAAAISATIEERVAAGSEEGQQLLTAMRDAVLSTYRTNFFVPDRYALGLRLDPAFLGVNEDIGDETPCAHRCCCCSLSLSLSLSLFLSLSLSLSLSLESFALPSCCAD